MTEIKEKYFTPREANKTLPLVKQIVRDILERGFEIKTIADSLNGRIEGNEEIESLFSQIQSYMDELKELGCYYKDWNFSVGLVDFPSIIDEQEVFLCWRSDERAITHYHGMHEGYAGRKRIPGELLDPEK
ncbi:MAG: DUF2203 domain-containing protein [Melioribacteraceae bacterium]|jgi:hypothetical protein|nr:DUF2203 domain-containing protein [Melioribacteraceae bacterium]